MRILIDLLHPAHVHFFKTFRQEMISRGHEVMVTSRRKDVTHDLLESLKIPHVSLSDRRSGRFGLGRELIERTWRLVAVAREFSPDAMTGIMGPAIALAGSLMRVPRVVFYDTEGARVTNTWVFPLSTAVCTPDRFTARVRGRHLTYRGYQELAYLHPKRFLPDAAKLEEFELTPPYFLVRFVSWQASHDLGFSGLTVDQMTELVRALEAHGQVVISAEGPVPKSLEAYRLRGPVSEIHHVLAFAAAVVGESGTMSMEAAAMGRRAVLVGGHQAGVFTDMETRYGTLRRIGSWDVEAILSVALEPAPDADAIRRQIAAENVDVTDWMVELFESEAWGHSDDTGPSGLPAGAGSFG